MHSFNFFNAKKVKRINLKLLIELYAEPLCKMSIYLIIDNVNREKFQVFFLKLSVPPISIYIASDAQLSPSSFGIFKSVC